MDFRTSRVHWRSLEADDLRVVLLVALTFVTGATDAVSYLGLQRVFTANMTGNVALLGFSATGVAGLSVIGSLTALLAFVVGAAIGGRVTRRADLTDVWPKQMSVALGAAVLLITAVFLSWVGRDTAPQNEVVAAGMAIAMGLQGAAARRLGVADLPTTVVTSTLTGLAADSTVGGGSNQRWRRRLASVVVLTAGAAAGASLVQISPALGLVPAVIVLVGVIGIGEVATKHQRTALAGANAPAAVPAP
jgi:uncharacterized membrane protein YoaK (UPF0700 family)